MAEGLVNCPEGTARVFVSCWGGGTVNTAEEEACGMVDGGSRGVGVADVSDGGAAADDVVAPWSGRLIRTPGQLADPCASKME